MKKTQNKIQGVISVSSKGTGYVAVQGEKGAKDVEVRFERLNTALNGDTVEIVLYPKAEVTKIISRAKTGFAGVLESEKGLFFVKPDDPKMYADILIPEKWLGGAKAGDKVFAEIESWTSSRKLPEGKIVRVLGKPGENNAEMHSIAFEKGFEPELPHKVEEEAERIKRMGISEGDYEGRRDFRKILTFTIDPEDAKDFDDAISFREISGGEYEVGIHIADVSHYVREGSALDEEALKRATSVYLVDRTIPMLPEVLSNDLCSLVPGKDRLTMSAVFVIDKNARVRSEWYGRTVIHSQKRFTYSEAEKSINTPGAPMHRELSILNDLAKQLTAERMKSGAISLEQEEVKFVLEKDGTPSRVIIKERGDSNRLIEEFMLLANRRVAKILSPETKRGQKEERVSLYRVHDLPSREKMEDLAFFLRGLGHKIPLVDGIIPTSAINDLLEKLKGHEERNTIERAVIRSMAKAVYSTKNIGHYGLAFPHYTHFTSPIRRYPDLVVHRLLMERLSGQKIKKGELAEYERIARVSSEQEKKAAEAERASIKYKQVEYMSKRQGEEFHGIITGISEWGIFVEEEETRCEGMVRIRDLKDDFYVFNEKKLELVGQRKKKKYRFGDRVKIKVQNADLERKTIDYALV